MLWAKRQTVNALPGGFRRPAALYCAAFCPLVFVMTRTRIYLLLVASFSLMFIGLVALGGHFWAAANKGAALGCFLLAFASVIGQMAALALWLRERQRQHFLRRQQDSAPSAARSDFRQPD